MKGITGNPALDAYQRVAVTPIGGARPADKVEAGLDSAAAKEQAATVSISNTARELATSTEHGQNAERVAEVKAQIDQGTYQVNSHAVAETMLKASG